MNENKTSEVLFPTKYFVFILVLPSNTCIPFPSLFNYYSSSKISNREFFNGIGGNIRLNFKPCVYYFSCNCICSPPFSKQKRGYRESPLERLYLQGM